jgi:hypothetical protein
MDFQILDEPAVGFRTKIAARKLSPKS